MNIVADKTIEALRQQGVPPLLIYDKALVAACAAFPPPFGEKRYGDLYRSSADDPNWVALSLITAAQSEGEGARHLWDMAACTPDKEVARQIQQHAVDESRHSLVYVTLLGLVFPEAASDALRSRLRSLSPGYTMTGELISAKGSPYAYPASVDELIQMNIAEIRTRIYHQLQRPVLLGHYCSAHQRVRVKRILDSLLFDETRHIAYTARLIEREAQTLGGEQVMSLMRQRVEDFNQLTEEELASGTLDAA